MTQMSLDDLYIWLSIHEDAYIITDIKNDNLAALKLISKTAAKQKSQIIPQIYNLNEFVPVTQLGFKDIILTLYRMNLADEKVIEFAVSNKIFAVTMPFEQALRVYIPMFLHLLAELVEEDLIKLSTSCSGDINLRVNIEAQSDNIR